jgi:hypothetical protein
MFRALFAHHQEALYVQQLVYFVHIMSAGCYHGWSIKFHSNPGSSHPPKHAQNNTIVVYTVPSDDEKIVLETCRGC